MEALIRSNVLLNCNPEGIKQNLKKEYDFFCQENKNNEKYKNVLIIGASSGYGLSSAIASLKILKANSILVYREREEGKKQGSSGYYNIKYLKELEKFKDFNIDCFSNEAKELVIQALNNEKLDLLIYSVASPMRIKGDITYKSVLKPIDKNYNGLNLDISKRTLKDIEIAPATEEEINNTIAVMGGEDWYDWVEVLSKNNLISNNFKTISYSYIGPEYTYEIYKNGTIGKAKDDLYKKSQDINTFLNKEVAYISINKAIVTKASAVIPTVPLYISVLYKIMQEKGLHEGSKEQIKRLFFDLLDENLNYDKEKKIRIDNLELQDDIQKEVAEILNKVDKDNFLDLIDIDIFIDEFLALSGFKE